MTVDTTEYRRIRSALPLIAPSDSITLPQLLVVLVTVVASVACDGGTSTFDAGTVCYHGELVGKTWVLDSITQSDGGVATLEDQELTLLLGLDGKVEGSTGCNDYFGDWATSCDKDLAIDDLAVTLVGCGALEVDEEWYIRQLLLSERFRFEGSELVIVYRGGQYHNGWEMVEYAGNERGELRFHEL